METQPHPAKRVLLIEDDFLLREVVTMVLGGEGYMVATASNGADAFQRLRLYEKPQLILLDLMMPEMDGWHFREKQKKDTQLESIPVVLISALGDLEEKASSLGAAAFLQKPVDAAMLLETVRRCCC
jgi:two-component system response regulator MprA